MAAGASEQEDVYVVEDIIAYKNENKKDLWRVRWKGYKAEDDTWEPRENLAGVGAKLLKKMDDLSAPTQPKRGRKSEPKSRARSKSAATRAAASAAPVQPPSPKEERETPAAKKKKRASTASNKNNEQEGNVRLIHLNRNPDGKLSAVMEINGELTVQPIEAVRLDYPVLLVDYFMERLKFKSDENH